MNLQVKFSDWLLLSYRTESLGLFYRSTITCNFEIILKKIHLNITNVRVGSTNPAYGYPSWWQNLSRAQSEPRKSRTELLAAVDTDTRFHMFFSFLKQANSIFLPEDERSILEPYKFQYLEYIYTRIHRLYIIKALHPFSGNSLIAKHDKPETECGANMIMMSKK